MVASIDGITPFRLLRDPYPAGFQPSAGAADGLLTGVGGRLEAVLRDGSRTPWNRQWNVTVQRELPWRTAVEIAYVGTEGQHLQTNTESGLNLNQLAPEHMSLGSQLNQLVPNPFFGVVNSGILVAENISRAQSLRPYPQFTDIIPLQNTGATSLYHALQISANRRMSGGLLIAGSYVWSKAEEEGESHQHSYDIAASRSVASYDIPHRLVLSALYEVPEHQRCVDVVRRGELAGQYRAADSVRVKSSLVSGADGRGILLPPVNSQRPTTNGQIVKRPSPSSNFQLTTPKPTTLKLRTPGRLDTGRRSLALGD